MVVDRELADFVAIQLRQPCRERSRLGLGFRLDAPVFLGHKGLDLGIALTDQAQRRALDTPGRQAALYLAPQQWREIEAHQIIQRAPGLLGIHEIVGDRARVIHGVGHRALGDLVKDHAGDVLVLDQPAVFQQLQQMPGNGLTFAVRVSGQQQVVCFLQRLRDLLDVFRIAIDHVVAHGEVIGRVDRAFLGDQIAHVAV